MWSPERVTQNSRGRMPRAQSRLQRRPKRATLSLYVVRQDLLPPVRLSAQVPQPWFPCRVFSASKIALHSYCGQKRIPVSNPTAGILSSVSEYGIPNRAACGSKRAMFHPLSRTRSLTVAPLSAGKHCRLPVPELQSPQHLRLTVDKVCDGMRGLPRSRKLWATAVGAAA